MLCDEGSHDVPMFPIFAVLGAAKKFHLQTQTCQKEMPPNMPASRARPNNPKQKIPGTATFLKAMLKIRMQPSSQAVPQGPPHMSCSTRTIVPALYHLSYQKKNIAVKVI